MDLFEQIKITDFWAIFCKKKCRKFFERVKSDFFKWKLSQTERHTTLGRLINLMINEQLVN